jgi:hypothetical protein
MDVFSPLEMNLENNITEEIGNSGRLREVDCRGFRHAAQDPRESGNSFPILQEPEITHCGKPRQIGVFT